MATWQSELYLKFAGERTQPAVDLVARISLATPARVIDLGCGPGNSTAVLAARWPQARIVGLDSSEPMLAAARRDFPQGTWVQGDIATWQAPQPFDLVFSNAALQWVPDHETLLPRLLAQLSPGGVLAVQMPANFHDAAHRLMRELAATERWRRHFPTPPREWAVHEPAFYYDLLAPRAARLHLWHTEYLQVMTGPAAIVEWYRGTGLRPWLDALPNDAERAAFVAEYALLIAQAYPPRSDGKVLFPFRRFFMVAQRETVA
ncbi:MAG: trans-aconitate 2-methyltransferase [Opitutales bacterium]